MAKTVKVTLLDASRSDGAGWPPDDLAGAIAWMQSHMAAIPEAHRASAKFEIRASFEYGDPIAMIEVSYERPETAEEIAKRLDREASAVAERENRERLEYELLKEKFEGPGKHAAAAAEIKRAARALMDERRSEAQPS